MKTFPTINMKTIMRFKRERINAENDKQKYGIQSLHYIKYTKIREIIY